MPIAPTTPEQPAASLTAVPLFHAAWLFAAGIALAGRVWLQPSVVIIALALIAVVCVVAALRAQRIAWLPLAALWILLGAWCGRWSRIQRQRPHWQRFPMDCCAP